MQDQKFLEKEKQGRKWDKGWKTERRERGREVFAWEEKEGRYVSLPVTLTRLIDLSCHCIAFQQLLRHILDIPPVETDWSRTDFKSNLTTETQDPGLDLREIRPDPPREWTWGASEEGALLTGYLGGKIYWSLNHRSPLWPMGKEPQMMRCLVNCRCDRMQCQKSLACETFDTADTTHSMFGGACWLLMEVYL